MNTVEERLTNALRSAAAGAPLAAPDWTGPSYVVPSAARPVRTGVRWVATGLAAAALVGAVAMRRSDGEVVAAAPWQVGTEFRISPSSRTAPLDDVARPGSIHFLDVPGLAEPISRYESITYEPTGVISSNCIVIPGLVGYCDKSGFPNILWGGAGEWLMWPQAPVATSFVRFDDGVEQMWQQVVGGVVFFPRATGEPTLTAYDWAGNVLGEASIDHPLTSADPSPLDLGDRLVGIPMEWRDSASTVFKSTLLDCLSAAGAVFPSANVPVLPAGVDPSVTWNQCVSEAKSAADSRFIEAGGTLPI